MRGLFEVLPVLAGSAVKGTMILGLAALAALWLKRASAAARHMAWQMGLLGLLALPVVTAMTPFAFNLNVLPALPQGSVESSAPAPEAPAFAERSSAETQAHDNAANHALTPPPAIEPASSPQTSAPTLASWRERIVPWLGVIWLAGVIAVLGRFFVGLLVARWFTQRAKPLDAIEWASLNETMSFAVGLGHPVKLLKSARAATPMTFGVINPVVLLPADADEWPEERRRIVLLHELAHVHRLDSLTHIFTQVACAIYWFNPIVWMAAARLRAEAERACDDWVLRAGMRASTYADHLLDMVRTIGRLHTPAAALPMAQRSTFEGRLLAILEPGMNRNGLTRGQAVLLTVIIALVVFPLAAVSPARSQPRMDADLPTGAVLTVKGQERETNPVSTKASAASTKSDARADIDADTNVEQDTHKAESKGIVNRFLSAVVGVVTQEAVQAVEDAVNNSSDQSSEQGRQLSPAALNALITALADTEVEVRREAVQALGNQEDPRAVAALSKTLIEDKDAEVRKTAAWALGQIEDSRAVPALSTALATDKDVEVRRTAAWALGQIESPTAVEGLMAALRDPDKEVRAQSVWALGEIEDRAAVPALQIAVRDSSVEIRKQAVWALGQIEDRSAVPALTAALRDTDAEVRAQAVWALGQIEVPEAVAPLVTMIADPSPNIRRQVAWALGQIESSSAVDALSRMLREDRDTEARQQAVWALGQIEDASAIPALTVALKDASVGVRRQAAWALGQIERRPAPAALLEALKDSDLEVRRTAVWAIGQIEDPNSAAALKEALKDTDQYVKTGALRALTALGDEAAYDVLAEMLKDPDPAVRRMAAQALGRGSFHWPEPRPQPQPQPQPQPKPRPHGG